MSFRRSKGAALVALDALQVPATVADGGDLLAGGDGRTPTGSSVLDLGRVEGWTSRTKPVATAVAAADHPDDDAFILVGGSSLPTTTTSIPVLTGGHTVPLRFRLAGDEPSGFHTAGWQIVRLQVDCADPESMIASSLDWRDQAQAAGRPDRPQQADRPARGSRGSQDRGTKGGRSER